MDIPITTQSIKDSSAQSQSRRAIMKLWDTLDGQISSLPDSYSEQFNYSYGDGEISLLSLLSRVDDIDELSRDEFSELVDHLIKVNPENWPDPEGVEQIIYERLFEDQSEEFSEPELDFAEGDFGTNVEKMLIATISTIYRDGVARVVDSKGKAPSEENNFLMSEDGKSFEGVFVTDANGGKRDKFPFKISEKGDGKWKIVY